MPAADRLGEPPRVCARGRTARARETVAPATTTTTRFRAGNVRLWAATLRAAPLAIKQVRVGRARAPATAASALTTPQQLLSHLRDVRRNISPRCAATIRNQSTLRMALNELNEFYDHFDVLLQKPQPRRLGDWVMHT